MAAKRRHRSTNEYLKYLKGELPPEERYSFERDLEADSFDMEALEGMEQLSADALEEDLLSLHDSLRTRLKRRRRRTWYYAAATIASLLIVGTVFINIYEINPKTASESIPADESFLHEDAGVQKEVPEQEAAAPREEKSETIVSEEAAPERDLTDSDDLEMEIAVAEEDVMEEDVEQLRVVEANVVEANVVEANVVEPTVVEANVVETEMTEIAEIELDEAAEAPAPVADQVVVREAQPKRSQKKERTLQAPAEAPTEVPVSYTSGRVSGIVLSAEDMEPLPGASIIVKGSDSGMVADMEGRFSLVADQQEQTTVIASYVGMETEEYQLAGGGENRLVMQPDLATLDEVVVIGYDAHRSVYATGAVQRVKLEQEEFKYSGAEPEGGLPAFKMYIEEQIRFPAGDSLIKREIVVLKFNVSREGSISNIQSLRSPGEQFTEEAIRLVTEGPSWKPARNESGVTDDVVRMRIVFKK